jgi:hypothetical protein
MLHARTAALVAMILLLMVALGGVAIAQRTTEQAHRVGNEPTEVLSSDLELIRVEDALLTRDQDRLLLEITMGVPTPGTYVYPDEVPTESQAAPEAFTLWAFVFNHPEHCTSGDAPFLCGPDDFSEEAKGGVYGLAGHVPSIDHSGGVFEYDRATGGRMTLTGEIEVGDPQRPDAPPGEVNFPLSNPLGAEVHVAIAPHGQIDPSTLAIELFEPAGNPGCGCWWGAFFLPGAS